MKYFFSDSVGCFCKKRYVFRGIEEYGKNDVPSKIRGFELSEALFPDFSYEVKPVTDISKELMERRGIQFINGNQIVMDGKTLGTLNDETNFITINSINHNQVLVIKITDKVSSPGGIAKTDKLVVSANGSVHHNGREIRMASEPANSYTWDLANRPDGGASNDHAEMDQKEPSTVEITAVMELRGDGSFPPQVKIPASMAKQFKTFSKKGYYLLNSSSKMNGCTVMSPAGTELGKVYASFNEDWYEEVQALIVKDLN